MVEHIKEFVSGDKTLITTHHSEVVSNKSSFNTDDLAPCSHEEADYRMILHVADMVKQNIKKIRILSNDTDVVIISLAFFHTIPDLEELWITFGTGKSKRFIPIHTIARRLGAEKCEALLGFHAITGCDSVSAFYGRGKKHAWDIWSKFPAVTEAFRFISHSPEGIPDSILQLIEQFVVRTYTSTLENVNNVNRARYELFQFQAKSFDDLPPTQNALKLHIQRAAYTAGHIWGQALQKCPILPSPLNWGYEMKEDQLCALWTTLPTLSKDHLSICSCKKQCKAPCGCVTKKVCCTSLCACRGSCYGQPKY